MLASVTSHNTNSTSRCCKNKLLDFILFDFLLSQLTLKIKNNRELVSSMAHDK